MVKAPKLLLYREMYIIFIIVYYRKPNFLQFPNFIEYILNLFEHFHKINSYLCLRYLRDSLHFVDKRRVAIWGWSYGGFIAAHALFRSNQNVFECGISIAPIVVWDLCSEYNLLM